MNLMSLTFFFDLPTFFSTLAVFYLFYISKRYRIFEYRLVLYLQISDFIVAIAYLIAVFSNPSDGGPLCLAHSFLGNFGHLSSIFYSVTISMVILLTLRYNYYGSQKWEWLIIIFNFVFPLILHVT